MNVCAYECLYACEVKCLYECMLGSPCKRSFLLYYCRKCLIYLKYTIKFIITIKVIRVSCVKIKNFSRFIELISIKRSRHKNLVTLWKLHHSALFPISNILYLSMDILLQCLNYSKSSLLHRFFYTLYDRWSESGESALAKILSNHI